MKRKNNNEKIIKSNLSTLVNKFSKSDVIVDMEKVYQSLSPKLVKTDMIDDNTYLKKARVDDGILQKIALNIKENGLKSPLVIRPKKDHFEIVLGRKRLLASKLSKVDSVPAVVIDVSDEEMLLMLLADNRDQRNANVIETALLCKELCSSYKYSQQTLSSFIHQSRSQITNIMRLLNLPDVVIRDISVCKLSYGHAKAIASLPESIVLETVDEIYNYHLSVREIENIVKRYKNRESQSDGEEQLLNRKYRCFTLIKKNSVTFSFNSEEEKRTFINDIIIAEK
jgi:ParB family chromosome partitioning protein